MATKFEVMKLSRFDAVVKHSIDFVLALVLLGLTGWIILIAAALAAVQTRTNGFFVQARVGRNGRLFRAIKIRTMWRVIDETTITTTTVTASNDKRITPLGRILRKYKIDELPQLFNVLLGQMSFVGPRPDVPGFADQLQGEDRCILSLRPGITGPATLYFRNEEDLLALQADPEKYNREVIYPKKIELNKKYLREYSLWRDFGYLLKTVIDVDKIRGMPDGFIKGLLNRIWRMVLESFRLVVRIIVSVWAMVIFLCLSPLLFLIAILIRLNLGSPVLFCQPRPGLHGKPFNIFKFRTMTDARDAQGNLLPDEFRLTPLGKFLRVSSLDELPELINIIKGEMSFVGPRPLLMEYLPLYTQEQVRRHEVRPGVTGWAQVNGRNAISWENKLKLDIWYVDNRSFWLDIKIVLMTIAHVIKCKNINQPGHATTTKFPGNVDMYKRLSASKLLIIGAGGHGRVVADAALSSRQWEEIIFLDDAWPELSNSGPWKVQGKVENLEYWRSICDDAIVAIGNGITRLNLLQKLKDANFNLAIVVHPSARVSTLAKMGPGSVAFANSVVNVGADIGLGVIVNTGAIVEHDCILSSGVHICPGVCMSGGVYVEKLAWIGIGSVIRQFLSIGASSIVGAGAVVVSDVPDNVTVVGVPAHAMRETSGKNCGVSPDASLLVTNK